MGNVSSTLDLVRAARDRAGRLAAQSWIVHREIALLLGWPRAILLQFAHPLVAQGVADHSRFTAEGFGRFRRLHRTLDAMLALTFGTDAEVAAVVDRINGIHDRVHGETSGLARPYPTGRSYSAHDPDLLLWVHVTCVQSFLLAYETFVQPLAPADRDAYCDEVAIGSEMLGIPGSKLPRSAGGIDRYVGESLESDRIVVTDLARRLARDVMYPPSAWLFEPPLFLLRSITGALLPRRIAIAYGFGPAGRDEIVLRWCARAARAILPAVPRSLRWWPRARKALARDHRLRRPAA